VRGAHNVEEGVSTRPLRLRDDDEAIL
jgi:hypothetical protein